MWIYKKIVYRLSAIVIGALIRPCLTIPQRFEAHLRSSQWERLPTNLGEIAETFRSLILRSALIFSQEAKKPTTFAMLDTPRWSYN